LKTKLELSELWNAALRGESRAFDLLHTELHPILYKSVLRSIKNEDTAHDLVQDLFVRLWVKRSQIGHIECILQYFLVSAKSVVINHIRKKSISTNLFYENLSTLSDPSPENVMIEKETDMLYIKNFKSAFSNLPDRQREVFYMKFHNGYSHYEIELRTGIRYQSIANHLYRATIRLRLAFGDVARPGKYFVLGQ
jgi:RNA polymerase sigma-70 factor (ECF subfamily)